MTTSDHYLHIVVEGLPYDRGLTHGRVAKSKISASLEHYRQPGKLLPLPTCRQIIDEVYLPGIKTYFPEALPELQGIADGAEVDLYDILLLNSRYDLARVKGDNVRAHPATKPERITYRNGHGSRVNGHTVNGHGHTNGTANGHSDQLDDDLQECTSAGFFAESNTAGHVFLAQNWDMSANIYLKDTAIYLEVHPDPSENLPVMFLMTEAGQLGRSGMNSAGLGVCASSLMSTEDYFPIDLSLPPGVKQVPLLPMSLCRRQFLHNTNFANGLVNIRNFPRHVSNKLVVGTADNFVMGLELTPSTTHLCYPLGSDKFVTHGNHFVSDGFLASSWADRYPGGSSWFRPFQVASAIRRQFAGSLTEDDITQAFCDHLSAPSSVCQHMEDCTVRNVPEYPYKGAQMTLAHVRYDLVAGTATVCKGTPCNGSFQTFSIGRDARKVSKAPGAF